MGIHMNHLSLFVVGGGDIFVGDIAVLGEGIESRVEVLCTGKKIASAGVVEVGLQALFDILCLDDLNDLLSLNDIPVGSVHAETVNRLITVAVSDTERPHKRIMVHALIAQHYVANSAKFAPVICI